MRILHLEYSRYPSEVLCELQKMFIVDDFECQGQEVLYARLNESQYGAIFTRLGLMIDKQAMDLQPSLKFIVTPTTGLNHIDQEEASSRGIIIVSLKGEFEFLASIKSTAEHTWGLLLSLIRRIPDAHKSVLNGSWDRINFLSDELDGKKLGVVGFGRLGKILARYGDAFGMEVLAYDHQENYSGFHYVKRVTLDKVLGESDFVVLLISWSRENEDFMDETKFNMMKDGAYFINTSRGELVNEDALLKMLRSGKLKGAALDVLKNDSAWNGSVNGSAEILEYARNHSNLLLTPHMGGYGNESIAKTRAFVTNKFIFQIKSYR